MASEEHDIQLVTLNENLDDDSSGSLVETEYIIQRPSDLTKELAINSLSAELLSQNIIEIASNSNVSPHTLTAMQYYDTDFLNQGFTDEERKLAAALLAVQLNQQRNNNVSSHNNVMNSDIINTKISNTLQHTLNVNEKTPVTNALSNYLQTIEHSKVKQDVDLAAQEQSNETEQCEEEEVTLKLYHTIRQEVPDSDIDENVEHISITLNRSEENSNDFESDYDNEVQTSRKSLPHKKRIANKLKRQQSTGSSRYSNSKCFKCIKCGEQLIDETSFSEHKLSHATKRNRFSCDICGKGYNDQYGFFGHLKFHYEPPIGIENIPITDVDTKDVKTESVNQQQLENVCVYSEEEQQPQMSHTINSGRNHSVNDSGHRTEPDDKGNVYSTQPTSKTRTRSKTASEQKEIKENRDHNLSSATETHSLTCGICGQVFRRKKAFDCHMSVIHPKKEDIEEFSEPEDMMEGIRHMVNVSTCDDEDRSDEWHPDNREDLKMSPNSAPQVVVSSSSSAPPKFTTRKREPRPVPNIMDGKPKKEFKCTHCTRTFLHRNSLFYHIRSHTGHRPYQCEVCGKSFYAAGALKIHMRFHSGERPYKCEYCDRRFRQWGDLKYHVTSLHTHQKMFQCEYCGKDFARKYSLVVHRRIHTGEKNYICEFCTKTFRAASYLQNHRRIHTGEKPHACEVCSKPFRVRSDLKRHMKTHGDFKPKPVKTKVKKVKSAKSQATKSLKMEIVCKEEFPKNDDCIEQMKLEEAEKNNMIIEEQEENDSPLDSELITSTAVITATTSSDQQDPLNLHMESEDGSVSSENIYTFKQSTADNVDTTMYVWIQSNVESVLPGE